MLEVADAGTFMLIVINSYNIHPFVSGDKKTWPLKYDCRIIFEVSNFKDFIRAWLARAERIKREAEQKFFRFESIKLGELN